MAAILGPVLPVVRIVLLTCSECFHGFGSRMERAAGYARSVFIGFGSKYLAGWP